MPEIESVRDTDFYLPGNMRGVILRPAPETGKFREEDFDELISLSMNTVIIATSDEENIYYNTDMNKSRDNASDYLSIAIDCAARRGLNVFLTFDINTVLYGNNDSQSSLNTLITEIHKFTLKYPSDGIILKNYYSVRNEDSFKQYMGLGAGIGYDNWLYESTESFFKTAADTVRLTDNNIPVGIMLNNFTYVTYETGFADTRAFVQNGHADFALVNAPDALTSSAVSIPFEQIIEHWGGICDTASVPMYVIHHNQKVGEPINDWNLHDQLIRQLSAAKKAPAYKGSIFHSHPDLMENRLNSTQNLQKFFNDQINEDTLFEDLTIHSPRSQSFSTNDAFAIFQGTYDSNFDVYLNNSQITLNEAGNFYLEKPLNVGMNYFTLNHKGKEVTYSIDRRVVSLHSIDASIANGRVLEVEGGTIITIGATAYRGADVTATLNGKTVRLTQQSYNLEDASLNASYAPFVGTYIVPAGIIGQTQNLGTITVTADMSGNVRQAVGASVRVIALPEPPPPPPVVETPIIDQHSAGSGEVVGRIGAVRTPNTPVHFVRVLNNNTATLPGNTTGDIPNPEFSRLPAGTIDYYRATVGNYHVTDNGRRVGSGGSELISGVGIGDNDLVVLSSGNTGRRSYFEISLDHRISFNVRAAGLNFSTAWGGDFNVDDFNATHIYIDFDNVTSVTKLPSFDNNLVFSGGRWETPTINGVPKFRLILELRRRGVYAGSFAQYNAEGNLMLTFPVITSSVAGMSIVIDPGHGINDRGWLDPGAIGQIREWDANIAIARKLRDRLNAMGANAHILPTESTFISVFGERNNHARALGCDLFISLHCNSSVGNSASRGTEVWYFTPFSQPLASLISANVAAYFQNNVYSNHASSNRGAKYSYFAVTMPQDYPSVLVELGFVTNMEDAMALANDTHQTGIANAIAQGVQQYLNR
jgi:N-acetylmuramoyl-L-alanine amidase